jgi:hypothetical protein
MAFYRLRRALSAPSPKLKLCPATRLADVSDISAKRLLRHLELQTRLRLPRKSPSWIGWLALTGLVAGVLLAIPMLVSYGWWGLVPVVMVVAARRIMDIDPGKFPVECQTLGGLAKKVSILNFGHLAKDGARANDSDLWKALTEVVARYSSVPSVEIRTEALLLESQREAA